MGKGTRRGGAPVEVDVPPSLAELRCRAAGRLRRLSAAFARLERRRAQALAECARLGVPVPPGPSAHTGGQEPPTAPSHLARALADNARLRAQLAGVLRFLDELEEAFPDLERG